MLETHIVDSVQPWLSSSDMTDVMSSVQQVCATTKLPAAALGGSRYDH